MDKEKIIDSGTVGSDASGLDWEIREELESESRTSALGRLGTSGWYRVMPEQYNIRNRLQHIEEGDN